MSQWNRAKRCSFCGEPHNNRRDYTACRARYRSGHPEPPSLAQPSSKEKQPGTPTTVYENDPLGGNSRDHYILRKHRAGWNARKIAKSIDKPLAEVRSVLERAGVT